MWRFFRWLYFATLWLGALIAAALTYLLWHRLPFKILGVGWGLVRWRGRGCAGVVALALVALDATMEISATPLPPAVSPDHEVKQWILYLIAGAGAATIFAADVGVLFVITHFLFIHIPAHWPVVLVKIIVAGAWIGWFIGTIYALGFISNAMGERFRTLLRYRLLKMDITPIEIRRLLEKSDLPSGEKAEFIARLDKEGMTPALADDILDAFQQMWADGENASSLSDALLQQTINNWKDEYAAKNK